MKQRTSTARTDPRSRPIVDELALPSYDGSDYLGYLAISESGEVLQEVGRQDEKQGDAAVMRPGLLYIADPTTGRRQLVRGNDDLHENTQTGFASLDKDYAVWNETPDASMNVDRWTMYAFNRKTRTISTVAKAPILEELGTAPAVPGWTIPRLMNGWVYWAEARSNPAKGRQPVVNIYGRRLGAADPAKLIVEHAAQPVATANWLYYARFDPDRYDRGHSYAIYRRNLDTGETTLIHKNEKRAGGGFLTGHGDVSAWVEGTSVVVYRGTQQIAKASGDGLFWLSAGRDTVGFTAGRETTGDFLLDLRTGCLHKLADTHGVADVDLSSTTIAWAVDNPADKTGRRAWHLGKTR